MSRRPITFADDQLRAIYHALQELSARYPDNRTFLRRAFNVIDSITGRSFGETVYRRLLAEAGIDRMPSTRTVQTVLAERRSAPAGRDDAITREGDALPRISLRGETAVLRGEVVSPVTMVCSLPVAAEATDWLTQHCEQLETQQQLRRELGEARERAAAEQARATVLAAQLADAATHAATRERELLDRLARVTDDLGALAVRLEGAERRRAVETDAWRQAFREERARLVARIESLEKDLAMSRQAVEIYRRRAMGSSSLDPLRT